MSDKRMRSLIFENDVSTWNWLVDAFDGRHEVIRAWGLVDGMVRLQRERFGCILLNVNHSLPGRGNQFLCSVHLFADTTPVLVYGPAEKRSLALSYGAREYFPLPLDTASLNSALNAIEPQQHALSQ